MSFRPTSEEEKAAQLEFLELLRSDENSANREREEGHFTASAWIVSTDRDVTLLTHHKKLGKWIQLGGHTDGDFDFRHVARKEAEEESGLKSLRLIKQEPIGLDKHLIPEHKGVKAHYHYDVRFLFEADPGETLVVQEAESHELKWVPAKSVIV